MACCLPTCARGFSFSDTGIVEKGGFGAFWLLFGALCILGVPALQVISLVFTRLGFHGGGIIFVTPWEFAGQHKKTASQVCNGFL